MLFHVFAVRNSRVPDIVTRINIACAIQRNLHSEIDFPVQLSHCKQRFSVAEICCGEIQYLSKCVRSAPVYQRMVGFSKPTTRSCRPHNLQSLVTLGTQDIVVGSRIYTSFLLVAERRQCEYQIFSLISFSTACHGPWSWESRN